MKLQWDESLRIGDEEIDRQHQRWIEFYNRLDALMQKESDEDPGSAKADILEQMSDYVDYHFQHEEAYMRSIGFPETKRHWRLHKDFRDEIYRICRSYREGTLVLNSEIMNMIKNWLLDHIIKHDMKMKHYLNSQKDIKLYTFYFCNDSPFSVC